MKNTNHSCHSLGVCQNRVPACNDCACTTTIDALDAWAVNVAPNVYCPVCKGDDGCRYAPEDTSTLTPFDRIFHWGSVGLPLLLCGCIVFGLAGFAAAKLGWVA